MEPEAIIAIIATITATSGVIQTVLSILKEYIKKKKQKNVKISHDGNQIEVNLDMPEQAKIYIDEYLSRVQSSNYGREK